MQVSLPSVGSHRQTYTVAQALVDQITTTYSREDAQKDGIYFWPEPLPTPDSATLPDPLVLFQTAENLQAEQPAIQNQQRIVLVPRSVNDMLQIRKRETPRPSMQIPLGLIDKPESQQRETLVIDLHGSSSALTGGPLLLAGLQNSGKATALQTILLWLTTRYFPKQLRCAVVDPLGDLSMFQHLPYFQAPDGTSLYTNGSSDELITRFTTKVSQLLTGRREEYPDQHWEDATMSQLWSYGAELPLLLLIVSNYQGFSERLTSANALKKLVLQFSEARTLGAYVILTSTEVNSRTIPGEIMGKVGTKIGLFLNEMQRFDLLGKLAKEQEVVAGRGTILMRSKEVHQIQLALPIPGATEGQRTEALKYEIQRLTASLQD